MLAAGMAGCGGSSAGNDTTATAVGGGSPATASAFESESSESLIQPPAEASRPIDWA